jgi:hypothetical protein
MRIDSLAARLFAVTLACSGLIACASADGADEPGSGSGSGTDTGTSELKGDAGKHADGAASDAGACADPSCFPQTSKDGKKDGTETDVDCGGSAAPACADGKKCGAGTDCTSGTCSAQKLCAEPTAKDGIKNGNETDVDCGGSGSGKDTMAPACAPTKTCGVDADCSTNGCDYQKKCAVSRSCTALHGGQTCGAGDFNDPKKSHESCCESVAVPGLTAKVDKYQITSGRMRAFVSRVKGDVRGWVQGNRATLPARAQSSLPASLDQYLPSDFTGDYGVYKNLGGFIYLTNQPSGSQGCFIGPNDGNYYSGAHTYYLDAVGQAVTGDHASVQTQDRLDEKSLNCVPYPILAAFCAWDGGFLASREDLDAAWGGTTYPWGGSPIPSGYSAAGGTTQTPATGSLLYANWQWNYFRISGDYEKTTPADYTAFVAPPGRYPAGVGKVAPIMDLAGNLMEITTTGLAGGVVKWSKNGSFEGHAVGTAGFQFPIMTKYGKAGGRCERL